MSIISVVKKNAIKLKFTIKPHYKLTITSFKVDGMWKTRIVHRGFVTEVNETADYDWIMCMLHTNIGIDWYIAEAIASLLLHLQRTYSATSGESLLP